MPRIRSCGTHRCCRNPNRAVVLTPHPAEMARLTGLSVSAVLADLPGIAADFAGLHGVTVVLKDAHTVIAGPDGAIWLSVAGNAGMARGGSGDLLAGVIGSLLVQARDRLRDGSLSVAAVAAAGVYLHGAAGDRCAAVRGEYGDASLGHSARALRRNARVVGQQNGAGEHIRAPLLDSGGTGTGEANHAPGGGLSLLPPGGFCCPGTRV